MADSFEYFKRDVIILGKHSRYVDEMWKQNQIQESFFKRLVDLYTIAPIIGLRTKRKAPVDRSEDNKRTVQVAQLLTKIEDLNTVMQMVLLLDETDHLSIEQRVNRAFRDPRSEEEYEKNMDLFNSYVRGGIEVLYENLVRRSLGIEDDYTDVRIGNIIALFDNPLSSIL